MSMQHLENEFRRQGKGNFADIIASVHKINGKDIPFPDLTLPKETTAEKSILKTPEAGPFPGSESHQDKKTLKLGIPFPILGWDTNIDFINPPTELVITRFDLETEIGSFPKIAFQIRLNRNEWVVESDPEEFLNYNHGQFKPSEPGFNPFFGESDSYQLRRLRFFGAHPVTRFKYHTLHTQPFKMEPRDKELYEGSIKFGPEFLSGKPSGLTTESYNDYIRRNTWGMFYFHNEERPDLNPKSIPWKPLL